MRHTVSGRIGGFAVVAGEAVFSTDRAEAEEGPAKRKEVVATNIPENRANSNTMF